MTFGYSSEIVIFHLLNDLLWLEFLGTVPLPYDFFLFSCQTFGAIHLVAQMVQVLTQVKSIKPLLRFFNFFLYRLAPEDK